MRAFLESGWAQRWLWLCPALGVVLAAVVLLLFGLSWRSALLAALLLVCPALLVWGIVEVLRELRRRRAPGNDHPSA